MSALALHQTRSSFLPWLSQSTLPLLQPILDLLPSIVLAVPKSKVSHSRKSMRSANKGLKDKENIVNCPGCGAAKLAHRACRTCYDAIIAKSRKPSTTLS